MAQTIKLKRSATSGAVPATSALELGEMAINTHDGKVYIKKDDGTESVVEVGDKTPAELLTDIKTVDGSGSGLDADLLDGNQKESFNPVAARYITAAGASGRLRITLPFLTNSAKMLSFKISGYGQYDQWEYQVSGYLYPSTNNWYLPKVVFTGTNTPDIQMGRDANGYAYVSIPRYNYMGVTVHSITLGYISSEANAYEGWSITNDATTAPNQVTPTVSKAWHSTNDGSGSGLDADLLDGQHGSYYAAASHVHSYLPLTGGTLTGALKLEGGSYSSGTDTATVALAVDKGDYIYSDDGTYLRRILGHTTSGAIEIGQNGTSLINSINLLPGTAGNSAAKVNGNTIWNAGNDGSGSGLDADLLDGQQGSYYYPASNPNGYTNDQTAAEILTAIKTVDGSGSGLDADSVDGYHAYESQILDTRDSGDVTPDGFGDKRVSYSFTDEIAGSTHTWDSVITVKGWSDTYRAWQITSNSSNDDIDQNLYFRSGRGATWGSLRTVWDSGNDGSGSGLDADLLDGVQGSGYVNTTGTQTIGGAKTFSSDLTAGGRVYVQGSTTNFLAQGPYGSTNLGVNFGNAVFFYSGATQIAFLSPNTAQFNNQIIADKTAATTGTTSATIISKGTVDTVGGYNPQNFHITFQDGGGTTRGSISSSHYSTIYSTSSDYRLKEDLQPISNATERLLALNPVNFKWIDGQERSDGFIAHELQEHLPEAVTGEKDATTEVTETVVADDGTETEVTTTVPDMQGIDQSKLVPLLVKTIQELEARITALENT